jgi:hypothetical protein
MEHHASSPIFHHHAPLSALVLIVVYDGHRNGEDLTVKEILKIAPLFRDEITLVRQKGEMDVLMGLHCGLAYWRTDLLTAYCQLTDYLLARGVSE